MVKRTLAPIGWFGGKGNMVKWVLSHIGHEPCKVFVDAFGGAGNIILNRHPAPVEVYNDLNGYLVNLYRVLRDKDQSKELEAMVRLTLYSRAEFASALQIMKDNPTPESDPVRCAWAMLVAYNQGFGGIAKNTGNWGRALISSRGMASNCSNWLTRSGMFDVWHERIKRMQIDNRPAFNVCKNFDSPDTLTYLDPPYPLDTRKGLGYAHEMSNKDHEALAEWALNAKGKVAISTYRHPIYDRLLEHGWRIEQVNRSCLFGRGGHLRNTPNSFKNNPERYNRIESLYMNFEPQQIRMEL